jgi:hypothetical protein
MLKVRKNLNGFAYSLRLPAQYSLVTKPSLVSSCVMVRHNLES